MLLDADLLKYRIPLGGPGLTDEVYKLPKRPFGPPSSTPAGEVARGEPVPVPDEGVGQPFGLRREEP